MRKLALICVLLAGCASGAGGSGSGGSGGGAGAAGTDPCAGLCTNPIMVAANTNSGDLGTAATCHQVPGSIGSVACGNFRTPRTFTVNTTSFDCGVGGGGILPPPQNGGWCMQAGAGNESYAYFATYNVR